MWFTLRRFYHAPVTTRLTPFGVKLRILAKEGTATLLAARKLIDLDPDKPNMAKGYMVDRAIDDAAFILERIDERWPHVVNTFAAKGLRTNASLRWRIKGEDGARRLTSSPLNIGSGRWVGHAQQQAH